MNKVYYIFLLLVSSLIFSCQNNFGKYDEKKITSNIIGNKDIGQSEPQKPLPLINNLSLEYTNEKAYREAKDLGIKLIQDTSDFRKRGNILNIYNSDKIIYTFTDSVVDWANTGEEQKEEDLMANDNVIFWPDGYFLMNKTKWFVVSANQYESNYTIIILPPYNNSIICHGTPFINAKGDYLLSLFYAGLGGYQSEWELFNISKDGLSKQITSYTFECNDEYKATNKICPCAFDSCKWISDKEALLKVQDYNEENPNERYMYLKLKVK